MVEQQSTEKLVGRARRGDRVAFEELVARHGDRVRAAIRARLGIYLGPAIDVDEVLQETLVRAFESIHSFEWRGENSLFRWLSGIAKHVLMKSSRKSARVRGLESRDEAAASGTSPSRALRRDERFDRLERALDSLEPDYSEVIRLTRIEGLKIREVAERMNRSPNAVKLLMARALKRLRREMGETESFHLPDRSLGAEEVVDGD